MDFDFDQIDFSGLEQNLEQNHDIKSNIPCNINHTSKYDNTTKETYRIKRQFKIDPLTDQEIPNNMIFEYKYRWDPYTGEVLDEDPIGPLCFNALTLYNYYYSNRFKGLWNPPAGQFEGYYGDLVGTGTNLEIKSRGANPEKYLFRIPIIDCYLPPEHNLSIITLGPILTDDDIDLIDKIVMVKGRNSNLKLKTIKEYYDCAITNNLTDPRFIKFKEKLSSAFTECEMMENFNRSNVDKLVRMKK